MNPGRWRVIKGVFKESLALQTCERESFVRRKCVGDTEVRDRVMNLVRVRRQVMRQNTQLTRPQPVHGGECAGSVQEPSERPSGDPDVDADDAEQAMPSVSDRVANRYELRSELGAGAFGHVFAAWDVIDGRNVAVKVVALTTSLQRFLYRRELATLRRGCVPGVVELLDDGDDGRWAFLVMELIQGAWFPGTAVARADFDALLPRAIALLEGVGRLHAAGVLHRDLKPSNVLVGPGDRVTLVDLGIAEDDTDSTRAERSEHVMGTPPYMAPERLQGRPATIQSDLFAVGRMLIDALTPEGPSTRPHLAVLEAAAASVELIPDHVPADVRELLRALVHPTPRSRPKTAGAALRVLRAHRSPAQELRLPRLGGRATVAAIVDAAVDKSSADVIGQAGSGKTRALRDAAEELRTLGHHVLWLTPSRDKDDPLTRLVPASSIPGHASPSDRDEAIRVRLRRWLEAGAVLLADDAGTLDPATQKELAHLRESGAVIQVMPGTSCKRQIEIPFLRRDDLLPLVSATNRIFHLRSDVADTLWKLTRGCAARVVSEIEAWSHSGLATWQDGLSLAPRALARIRASGALAVESVDHMLGSGLHETVVDVWNVLSLAGVGLNADSVGRVLERAPRRVRGSIQALIEMGALALDELGRAWTLHPSPHVADLASDRRAAWSCRIAAELPARSYERFHHLMVAERPGEACRTASDVANAALTAGRAADARLVLDIALTVARRDLPEQVELYVELLGLMAQAAMSQSTEAAISLARYHVELGPPDDAGVVAWGRLMHAAELVLNADPRRALALLDEQPELPTPAHHRLHHIIANRAANRTRDLQEQHRRVALAVPWVRDRQTKDARALLAAWTGWLRFEQQRHGTAAGLHRRAKRLSQHTRARTTALCNAAGADIEAGNLEAARTTASDAIEAARDARDSVNLARAERLLRAVTYRLEESVAVDEELVDACAHLGRYPTRGMILLGEAAIAWRAGLLGRAGELAGHARDLLPRRTAFAARILCAALAAACTGGVCDDIREWLADDDSICEPPGLLAQAVALVCDVVGPDTVPTNLRRLAMAWAQETHPSDARREILTPAEVAARISPLSINI